MPPPAYRITPPVPDQPFILIHTDGSCLGNPGPGGWGAVLRRVDADGCEAKRKEIVGGEPHTTNNRMELRAAIEALRALKRSVLPVVAISDSAYVRGGITTWLPKWKANGWMTAGRKPVLNMDLWVELEEIARPQRIDWRWTKGHAGDPMNEEVDRLARKAAEAFNGDALTPAKGRLPFPSYRQFAS